MADLTPRRPLAGRTATSGAAHLTARDDLTAYLVTTRDPTPPPPGTIPLGPCEHMIVAPRGAAAVPPSPSAPKGAGAALVQDMTAGLAFVDIAGPAAEERLGLPPIPPETGTATRLADLRVIVQRTGAGGLRVIVGRSYAEYMWGWLAGRLAG